MVRRSLPIFLAGLLLTGVLAIVLVATNVEDSPIARKVYFADNISPAHLDAIERFNREHAGRIEVVPVSLPFSKFSTNERKELLARSLRNKSDRIDIFSVDLIWVPRFSKWSEPMTAKFDSLARKTILPFALESCEYGDTLVAVPLYVDIGLMYYRSDLVRKLPDADSVEERLRRSMTWDEFLALGKRLGLPPGTLFAFQGDEYEGALCNYFEFLVGRDSLFFRRDSLDFESPAARQALQDMVDLVYRYRVSPVRVTELDEIRSYQFTLTEGIFAVRGWPNFLESFNATRPDTRPLLSQLRRAALPHPAGGRASCVYGGWNLMVTRNSANKAEAMEFIKFLQREDTQKRFFEIGGYLPTSASVYLDSAYMAKNPVLAYYRQLLDRGFHRPALPAYTQMSDILSHGIHRALLREVSAADALQEAARQMRETHVLSKR
jgi:multiple sugar transport system substrate-binding protein